MPTKAAKTIGKNVRHYRLKACISEYKAAYAAGITRGSWRRIESGTANPTVSTLEAIAFVLDVPLNSFFTALWPSLTDNTNEADKIPQ